MGNSLPENYFVPVHPFISFVIIIGLFGIIQMMALQPFYLLYFGPFGQFLFEFSQAYPSQIFIFFKYCMYTHCIESIIAFVLSVFVHGFNVETTIKWTFSTFVNGMIGLRLLIWHK